MWNSFELRLKEVLGFALARVHRNMKMAITDTLWITNHKAHLYGLSVELIFTRVRTLILVGFLSLCKFIHFKKFIYFSTSNSSILKNLGSNTHFPKVVSGLDIYAFKSSESETNGTVILRMHVYNLKESPQKLRRKMEPNINPSFRHKR